jgi:purine-binding chemotaxis protein CheW
MAIQPTVQTLPDVHGGREDRRTGKYLSFFLGTEEYGLEILKVQEIIGNMPITPVPRTPEFIRGVINLRGTIHPIMDLRMKLGMERTRIADQTCIIVVSTSTITMGILVDRVSEVINIASTEIEDTPSFGTDIDTDYLLGVAKIGGRVRLLLNIEKVITAKDILRLKNATGGLESDGGAEAPIA